MITITKEMFITLMGALENIGKTLNSLEALLDTNLDEGPLPSAFDSIANLI